MFSADMIAAQSEFCIDVLDVLKGWLVEYMPMIYMTLAQLELVCWIGVLVCLCYDTFVPTKSK